MSGPIFHGFPLSLILKKPKKQNWHLLALIIIIITATIIRFYNLPRRSLWFDEIFSVHNAQQGPIHILTSHDPARSYPYHLVLWLFLQVGDSEFIARLPSVIYSILSIPLFYVLAKTLYNEKVALLSTFMLAWWPYHVWYAQEARMYSLFFLVTVASMLLFHKALKRGVFWLPFALVTVLGLYTHFYYIFLVGIQALYLLYLVMSKKLEFAVPWWFDPEPPSFFMEVMIFGAVMLGLLIPWVHGALSVGSGVGLNIPWGFTATTFWQETFSYLSDGVFGAVIGVPIFLFGLVHTFREKSRDVAVLTSVWVFAPLTVLFAITALLRPMTHNRYMLFILPAYLMMLAYGLVQLCECLGSKRTLLGAFLLATMIFGTFAAMTIVTFPIQRREDWRAVTRFINDHADSDDAVLIYPSGCDKCLDYYGIQHDYRYKGTHSETVDWALERNGTVWIVYYGWGVQKECFEAILEPAGFTTALYCYQISIYKR